MMCRMMVSQIVKFCSLLQTNISVPSRVYVQYTIQSCEHFQEVLSIVETYLLNARILYLNCKQLVGFLMHTFSYVINESGIQRFRNYVYLLALSCFWFRKFRCLGNNYVIKEDILFTMYHYFFFLNLFLSLFIN